MSANVKCVNNLSNNSMRDKFKHYEEITKQKSVYDYEISYKRSKKRKLLPDETGFNEVCRHRKMFLLLFIR